MYVGLDRSRRLLALASRRGCYPRQWRCCAGRGGKQRLHPAAPVAITECGGRATPSSGARPRVAKRNRSHSPYRQRRRARTSPSVLHPDVVIHFSSPEPHRPRRTEELACTHMFWSDGAALPKRRIWRDPSIRIRPFQTVGDTDVLRNIQRRRGVGTIDTEERFIAILAKGDLRSYEGLWIYHILKVLRR